MKILSLRFKNLNALMGQWAIDFTHPAYQSEGIFAITGPTGAGKSTILDALCLALYGRTPRLGAITQSSNEIMTRHTGECFAEVVFATQSGRFCCHWGQHRARRQPDGALQPAKHELSEVDTGQIIATGARAVEAQIPQLTGLDFQRFTRSMLLAQGGFAAFLQADADERAPLLEQITGTEIYAQISRQVHEQRRVLALQYQNLQQQAEEIVVLDDEVEQALKQQVGIQEAQLKHQQTKLQQLQQAIDWWQELETLTASLAQCVEQEQQLAAEQLDFAADQQRLDWAEKALTFEEPYGAIQLLQEQLTQENAAQQLLTEQLPALQQNHEQAVQAAEQAKQALQEHEQGLEALQSLWQQVQQLDGQRERLADARENAKKDKIAHMRRVQQVEQDLHDQQAENARITQAQQEIARYQSEHAADARLESELERLLWQIQQYQQGQHRQQKLNEACDGLRKELERLVEQVNIGKQQFEAERNKEIQLQTTLQQAREQLGHYLAGESIDALNQQVDDAREKLHLRRLIASMETHRAELESGQPCPLCGSLEHPYVAHEVPTVDTYAQQVQALQQRFRAAIQCQNEVQSLQADLQAHKERLNQAEQSQLQQQAQVAIKGSELQQLTTQQTTLNEQQKHHQQQLQAQLEPFGLVLDVQTDYAQLIEQLRHRQQKWQEQAKQAQQLQSEALALERHKQGLKKRQDELNTEGQEVLSRYSECNAAYQAISEKREQLFGQQSPVVAQQQWHEQYQSLQQAREKAQLAEHESQRLWRQKQDNLQQLQQRMTTLQSQLQSQQEQLKEAVLAAGFASYQVFIDSRLPTEQRQALAAQAEQLKQRQIRIASTKQERSERLAAVKAKALSETPKDALQQQQEELKEQLVSLQEQFNENSYRLRDNEAAKKRRLAQQHAARKQQKELQRWSALHDLIGSSDGKKYRNFAQGLSFAQLVYYANQQLQTMSDRYLLLQDETNPLELNVIDNYQGGVVRSTQNLSGGESFIVSLALALGLSKMASQNVRIDSLFLDEGFGTLDEEALSLALDTLANLRQESKLIGVISHVRALQERIPTRIEVHSNQRGHSRLSGPGCSHESS